jgi:uncharacterized repeat protein (TIGR01451 family)
MNSGSAWARPRPLAGTRHRMTGALLALTLAGLGGPLAAGTANAAASPQADLAVTETVSSLTPFYYTAVTFTTTVTNASASTPSHGISVTAMVPAGLIKPARTPSQGSYRATTSTWTVGSLAPGASATLTFSGYAGAVALGLQTVTATAAARTPDPDSANNTAAASETAQPAQLGVTITPSPDNPANIDLSLTGSVSWTGSAYNSQNPAAPPPGFYGQWFCATASGNPCPPASGTDHFNVRTLTYMIHALSADTYTITFQATAKNSNYTGFPTTDVTFTVSNSGAG